MVCFAANFDNNPESGNLFFVFRLIPFAVSCGWLRYNIGLLDGI
jgi:hypothetical protein